MLICNSISASVGKATLLKDISFSAAAGSFTAIIGKNGSGKSTLCERICGLAKYTGSITVCGDEISSLSPQMRAGRIAFLPQSLPSLQVTVNELVSFGRSHCIGFVKSMSARDLSVVSNAIASVGLSDFANRSMETLSGGERQRAFLAMALAQDTDILVLDEPTAHLDAAAESEFVCLLKSLAASGKTLIVTLHNLSLAAKYSDKLLILQNGEKLFFENTENAISDGVIEKAFSVRKITNGDEVLYFA